MVPLLLVGLLKLCLGRSGPCYPWPGKASGEGPLDPRGPCRPWPGGLALGSGALGPGPLALARKPLARGGALGPDSRPWPGRPGGPWLGAPLVRGPEGPWTGGPLARLARGALGAGFLARGPLGQGGPWPEKPQNAKLSNQPAWTPPPASWSRNPATKDQGAPGGGGPTNPEPKTLNRPPEAKGYDLGLYFSYAKGGLGAGHPLAEY